MKLITTLAILSVVMMIIGQAYSIHSNEQLGRTERKVEKKVERNNKKAESRSQDPKAVQPIEDDEVTVSPFGAKDTKFLLVGDVGQVDTYFQDYIKRSMTTDVKTLEVLGTGKFENFEKIMNANSKATYEQAVILGDFLYTENKKGNVSLSPVDATKLADKTYKRSISFKGADGKDNEVSTIFDDRLAKSTEALNTLLGTTYSKNAPFWLLLNGNHSYDVDAIEERKLMSKETSKVRMYKHSKVHCSAHACFADLNFGDIACMNQSYLECFNGALSMARFGRNEAETRASIAKIVEAILTLQTVRSRWRIIRTHNAPFNSEIDQHYLFNLIKGKIQCKARKAIAGLDVSDKDLKDVSEIMDKIDASKIDLTPELLQENSPGTSKGKDKIVNRIFSCEMPEPATADKDKTFDLSIMKIIDRAAPHFYLGSHLHASQLLFAPKINTYNYKAFKQSEVIASEALNEGCKEINYVKKYADLTDLKATPPFAYKVTPCGKAATEDTIEIKDKPEYNIIFVIGNSGRFLDPFVDGTKSQSHIVWQRINAKDGLAFTLMKDKVKNTPEKVINADKSTAYGFAELTTFSNDQAIVEFKELDPADSTIKSVLKITLKKGAKTSPEYKQAFGMLGVSKDTAKKLRKLK